MSGEMHLGGVASEIIQNARKPVLLVRLKVTTVQKRQQCEAVCHNLLDHVLFATDFSDNAEHAFATVREVVERGAKRVTLMHVQDKSKIGKHLEQRLSQFNAIDRERLERLRAGVEPQKDCRCGLRNCLRLTGG